jgi:hypothetical protein
LKISPKRPGGVEVVVHGLAEALLETRDRGRRLLVARPLARRGGELATSSTSR